MKESSILPRVEIKHSDTYLMIVKTAQQLFMTHGYRGVSTRKIAEQCGITQPALYHHFQNKQTLYAAVIHFTLNQTETVLQGILQKANSFRERLFQTALYMINNFRVDLTQMFHDIVNELSTQHQQEIHKWWVKGFLHPVVKMIDDGRAAGQIRDLDTIFTNTTELAYILLNLIKSVLPPTQTKDLPNTSETEKKAKLIVELFLNGVSK